MDPASVAQWPRTHKRKAAFNSAQKAWLDEQYSDFHKSKSEGAAVMVLAQELSDKMEETWPAIISEEDMAQVATQQVAKLWALRSRGSSIYWYYTNKQRGKKMGKTNSGALNLHGRKPRKKSQAQCFATLYYKELDLEALAVAERLKFINDNPLIAKKWRVAPTAPTTSSANIHVLKGLGDDDDDDDDDEDEVPTTNKKKETDPTAIVRFRQIVIKRAWAEATDEQKRRTLLEWSKQGSEEGSEDSDDDSEGEKVPQPTAAGPSGGQTKAMAKLKAKQEAERSKCIAQIEQSFRNALHSLFVQTGWKGFVCLGGLGGPRAKPGQLSCVKVSSKMSRVKPFEESYANFDQTVGIPFGRWLQAEFTAEIDEAKGLLPNKVDVSFDGLIPLEKQESPPPPPGSPPLPSAVYSLLPSIDTPSLTPTGLESSSHALFSTYSPSTFSALNSQSPPATPLMTPAMLEPADVSPVPGFHPRSRVAPSRPPVEYDLTQSLDMPDAAAPVTANSESTSTVSTDPPPTASDSPAATAVASASHEPGGMGIDSASPPASTLARSIAPSAAGLTVTNHCPIICFAPPSGPPNAPLGITPGVAIRGPAVASVSAGTKQTVGVIIGSAAKTVPLVGLLEGSSSPSASSSPDTTAMVEPIASMPATAHPVTLTPASTQTIAPVLASGHALDSALTAAPPAPPSSDPPTSSVPTAVDLNLSSPGVQQLSQATVVYASAQPAPLVPTSVPPEESLDPGHLITHIKNVFANVDGVYFDIACMPTGVKAKAQTWINLADTLARFEHSFNVPGSLSTKAAPKSINIWIASPDSNISVSPIQHITHVRKWWISLQPSWRKFGDSAPSGRAVRSWDSLYSTGVHGISMVPRALWWWEKKYSRTSDGMDAVDGDVMALLTDITTVLGIMLDDNAAGFPPSGYANQPSPSSVAPAASALPIVDEARKRLRTRTDTESRKRQKTTASANTPEVTIARTAPVKKGVSRGKGASAKSAGKNNTRRK